MLDAARSSMLLFSVVPQSKIMPLMADNKLHFQLVLPPVLKQPAFTQIHSEWPKLNEVLANLSERGLS